MRNKICMICKLTVEIPGHEHVKVNHQSIADVNLSKGFYHINCFRKRLNGDEKVNEMYEETMGLIERAKELAGIPKKDKEVTII